jgi:hypothetical protein
MGSLSVFFGHASNAEARVYAQWQGDLAAGISDLMILGMIVGPYSAHARTLPAKMPFRFLGGGDSPLAEAIVPDPCFWTPESPNTYRVNLEVQRQGEVVHRHEQLLGIRPLGVRGRSFYFDSRRWVLRGGFSDTLHVITLADLRVADLATKVSFSDDSAFLATASELGVLLVGQLSGESENALAHLEELARWPAVGMVLMDTALDEATLVASRPRNVLLGQRLRVDETMTEFQPAQWADFVVGDVDDPALFVTQTKTLHLPVVACRQGGAALSPQDIRTACEQLQQELAPHGDFAGYLV